MKEASTCYNQIWKWEDYYWAYRNKKFYKITVWTSTYKMLDILSETDRFLHTHKLPKLTPEETENLNKLITREWISNLINTPSEEKAGSRWLHWLILPKIQIKMNTNPSQIPLKK
jgi:hypothetical protein